MGTTYYVSAANGNNNNPGNESNKPLRTIQAAINKAQAGDAISVGGGSYSERLHIQKPGTVGSPLVIAAQEGQEVIIDGSRLPISEDSALVVVQQSQDIALVGLAIRNSGGRGLLISKSSRVTISGCVIELSHGGGLLGERCDTLRIEKCKIHHSANRFLASGASGSSVALAVRHSKDVIIQENVVHENSDEGILIQVGCEAVVVRKNTCYDNRNGQVGVISSIDVLIDSNLCYHTGNQQLLDLQGGRGPGITKHDLARYKTGGAWHTRKLRVINNIVVGCGAGFRSSRSGGRLTNFQLAHNTILDSTSNSIELNVKSPSILSYIENNLIASGSTPEIARVSNGDGVVWRNNLWSIFPGPRIFNPVSDIVETNLGLAGVSTPVVAGAVTADSYKLASGSVAIDRGVFLRENAEVDFWGNRRDSLPDIGASEYPNSVEADPIENGPLPNPGTRVTDGLVVLYKFDEGRGKDIKDGSGVGQALNLRIRDESAVRWSSDGLHVEKPVRIVSEGPAKKVNDACRATNEITLEAWVTPANITQDGPARIISISSNKVNRNVTLGQGLWGDEAPNRYMVRLRTTQTSANGLPAVISPPGTATASLSHVVYTRTSAGLATLYINGQARGVLNVGGKFTNWDSSMAIMIANELSDDRPWLGLFRLAAVYSRALKSAEVLHNYEAGFYVPEPPTAEFSIQAGDVEGVAPHIVEFDSSGSSAEAGIAGYFWEFGDGQTSNQANPTHTYSAPGIFTVSLTITDKKGKIATITKAGLITVVTAPLPPLPTHYARFIMVEVDTSIVRAFGVQYPNYRCAVLWNEEPSHLMVFADADDVERSLTKDANLVLVWVDELESD